MKISLGLSISDTKSAAHNSAEFFAGVSLTLNALAFSVAGSTIASRKNSDGNYYTVSFPDDFVETINDTGTLSVPDQGATTIPRDPFAGFRSAEAPFQIDTPMRINIIIPEGMSIGTNSYATHVKSKDVFSAWDNGHSGLVAGYGTVNYSAALRSDIHHFREASADPCLMIDFNTDKVTQTTINDTIITIENSGNTLGGGGYGGMGGVQFKVKGNYGSGGGGGGAGMGLHQIYSTNEYPTEPTQMSYYQFSNVATSTGATGQNIPDITGEFLPVAGVGGLGYNWWPHVTTDAGISNYAANGTSSDIDSAGAGGAGQQTSLNVGRSYPSLSGSTSFQERNIDYTSVNGGWGGNVVYFRSNVWTDTAISGTQLKIINKSTGYMRGGAGGGGGGSESSGSTGQGGDGGSWYSGGSYNTAAATGAVGKQMSNLPAPYTPGLEGSLIFWNTSNVAVSNTFTNERADGNWMQGKDIRVT